MWKSFIAILCASGTVLGQQQPQSVLVHTPDQNLTINDKPQRRLSCPNGFVRLQKNCFYFSAGLATWQDAHFYCKDRNSKLATLTKKNMNRRLMKYLRNPQLNQVERWIGARYNWQKMIWEWGITGEKIDYNGFSKLRSGDDQLHKWQCAVMNPERNFRWAARSCIDSKHYVCHTLATGTVKRGNRSRGRKRRQRIQSLLSKNGTLNEIDENEIIPYNRPQRWRTTRKSRPMWRNGMRLGMKPPTSTRWAPGAKYSDRLQLVKGKGSVVPDQWISEPNMGIISSQNNLIKPSKKEYSGNSPGSLRTGPKALIGEGDISNRLGGQLKSVFYEEILLKN